MPIKPKGAQTVEEYLSLIDEPRQTEVRMLYKLISKAVPELKPSIQARMIGFGAYHAVGRSGEGDWPVIALASQNSYISVYVAMTGDFSAEQKASLKGASLGKCCIRIKKLSAIDPKALEIVIKNAADQMKRAGYRTVAAPR